MWKFSLSLPHSGAWMNFQSSLLIILWENIFLFLKECPEILSRAFLLDTIHLKVWQFLADLDLLSAV